MSKFKLFYIVLSLSLLSFLFFLPKKEEKIVIDVYEMGSEPSSPVSLKTYSLVEKYAKQYNIPKYIAYNVLYLETRYMGPFHWDYNPYLTSSSGCLGPMQIKPSTADWLTKKKINKETLKNDLELNISIGMELLNFLYKEYNDWLIVCSYYNTGQLIPNDYALYCVNNKDYTNKWKNYKK